MNFEVIMIDSILFRFLPEIYCCSCYYEDRVLWFNISKQKLTNWIEFQIKRGTGLFDSIERPNLQTFLSKSHVIFIVLLINVFFIYGMFPKFQIFLTIIN